NINNLVTGRHVSENNSVRHINQNVTNTFEISEKMTVVVVVPNVIVYKINRFTIYFFNHVAKIGMIIVVLVKFIGIRMISTVIVLPAICIPAVSFPVSVPVKVFFVIVIPVVIFVMLVVRYTVFY